MAQRDFEVKQKPQEDHDDAFDTLMQIDDGSSGAIKRETMA